MEEARASLVKGKRVGGSSKQGGEHAERERERIDEGGGWRRRGG